VAHLLTEFEALNDFFYVVAESAQVLFDVCQKDLLVVCRSTVESLERPFARIVEDVA